MAFSLLVGNDYIGSFGDTPYSGFNYGYYCQRCGEVIARRVEEGTNYPWVFVPVYCSSCGQLTPDELLSFSHFRIPGELIHNYSPPALLAAEFLYNFPIYMEPRNDATRPS